MTSNIVDCGKFLQFGLSVLRPTVEVALLYLTSPNLHGTAQEGSCGLFLGGRVLQ